MTLQAFFQANPRAALAFSGGVDSAYLLWAGRHWGCDLTAYYVRTAFQPEFEYEDARRLAEEVGVPLRETARRDGHTLLLDGTNASDDAGDRPGMRALRELEVRSPLRECGLTKAEIRAQSKEAGLFTWNKPAYACLATRIPTGTAITAGDLERVEAAEGALFALGFTDFRVRLLSGAARIQLPADQWDRASEQREAIRKALSPRFDAVLLDLETR